MNNDRKRLDDNLLVAGDEVRCVRCDAVVGSAGSWLDRALIRERPTQAGGSLVHAPPETFVDAPIVYRQAFCPGCLTVLLTEIIAVEDRDVRTKQLG